MERILDKEKFENLFEFLRARYDIIGPTRMKTATTYAHMTFDYVKRIDQLELKYQTTIVPPKRLLLPDNEALFSFKKRNGEIILEDLLRKWEKKHVFLGIHPCDVVALSCLDKVFSEVYRDPYYWNSRENTIIIALTCDEPEEYCFCNVVGAGPNLKEGYDLLMTDLGDRYFVEAGSGLGESLLKLDFFRSATPEDKKDKGERLERVKKRLEENRKNDFKIEGLTEVLRGRYNDVLWDEYYKRCVTCGACNMVCPTCHCFAIIDKTNVDQTEGKRVRIWDSCHFERFARMAGGIDFREEKSSRFKHRIYDKFFYTVIVYGTPFCVGCGRCIKFCWCGIDIRGALKKLTEG
jgi:ferredoxin